jgi:hypothetical protein
METYQTSSDVQQLLVDIDRLVAEMMTLRERVARLETEEAKPAVRSVREASYFGVWAEREDMSDCTSRQWLQRKRQEQWQFPTHS